MNRTLQTVIDYATQLQNESQNAIETEFGAGYVCALLQIIIFCSSQKDETNNQTGKENTMDEDEDMMCPLCKHGMRQQHLQMLGAYGYYDWWVCDWCGYETDKQEHIFTAKGGHDGNHGE